MPDVTSKQFEQKSYFEVVIKTDQVTFAVSRPKLLSQLAAVRGGQLYLMVPKGSLRFAKSMVGESRVTAEVINLRCFIALKQNRYRRSGSSSGSNRACSTMKK